jgi:hypothetical protein
LILLVYSIYYKTMAAILYYSNFCEHSKKLLQSLSKTQVSKEFHFICIDKRVKGKDNKVYIVLENGQQIVMPENVQKVPALLLLTQNYKVLYGDQIYDYMKPQQQVAVKQATQNNMEPMAFSFGGSGIVSDQYSFLDMGVEDLNAKGNGGLRQMHNYVSLNDSMQIPTPKDDYDYKNNKIPEDVTIEKLQQQRDQDLTNFGGQQRR